MPQFPHLDNGYQHPRGRKVTKARYVNTNEPPETAAQGSGMRRGVTPRSGEPLPPDAPLRHGLASGTEEQAERHRGAPSRPRAGAPLLFPANRAAPSLCTSDMLAVGPWTPGSDSGHDAPVAGLRRHARNWDQGRLERTVGSEAAVC